MKLNDRLIDIKNRIASSISDISSALAEKGVLVPEDMLISEVASYIRKIFQSDFEFFFNFRDVDQFGKPHAPSTGQPAHYTAGELKPEMFELLIPRIDMSEQSLMAKGYIQFNGAYGVPDNVGIILDLEPEVIQPLD